MSMNREQGEFLKDAAKLILAAESFGLMVTGGELYRTQEQQDLYLASGKSQRRHSYHQDRMAIDLNFFKENEDGDLLLTYNKSDIQELGDYWESLNELNKWGGNWNGFVDTPHFQRNTNVTN